MRTSTVLNVVTLVSVNSIVTDVTVLFGKLTPVFFAEVTAFTGISEREEHVTCAIDSISVVDVERRVRRVEADVTETLAVDGQCRVRHLALPRFERVERQRGQTDPHRGASREQQERYHHHERPLWNAPYRVTVVLSLYRNPVNIVDR